MRQCSSRYAFHAGRNLPDKELRYLRTVIVTAAVYRGFGRELSPSSLTYRHRAGVRRYTSSCELAASCVFDKQSKEPIYCGPPGLLHPIGRPLSRTYGAILQSSLTSVLPSALDFSSRLPVSVLVRSPSFNPRSFSWTSFRGLPQHKWSRSTRLNYGADLPIPHLACGHGHF